LPRDIADYCHFRHFSAAYYAISPFSLIFFFITLPIIIFHYCRLSLSLPFATFSPFFIAADAAFHFRPMIARYFAAILLKRRAAPPCAAVLRRLPPLSATARHAIAAPPCDADARMTRHFAGRRLPPPRR
jgi:hypothetical protein